MLWGLSWRQAECWAHVLLLTIEVDKQLSSSSYSSWRPLGAVKELLNYQVSWISTVKISKFNQRRMSFDLNDLENDSAKNFENSLKSLHFFQRFVWSSTNPWWRGLRSWLKIFLQTHVILLVIWLTKLHKFNK